jgi:GNAT superfamily N-acetyltransferase
MWITNCLPVSDIQIRIARSDEYSRVLTVYAALGYRRTIDPADTVWLAESAQDAVGIVRVAEEEGTLVLRGMRVAEHARRQRSGTRMLEAIAEWLGDRECYCVPYSHLAGFYGQIGFVPLEPAAAPAFLSERLAEYRRNGQEVILMRRATARLSGGHQPPTQRRS